MKLRKWLLGSLSSLIVFASLGLIINPEKASAAMIGNVEMSGDATFNSDTLADSSASQPRWLSYPGARLTLNANQADVFTPAGPMSNKLEFNVGGWFGSTVFNWNNLFSTQLSTTGGSALTAGSVSTTWYPYKIDYSASSYSGLSGHSLTGYDYFIDDNATMIRYIKDNASTGNDVVLSGVMTGSGGGSWDSTNRAIVVTDTKYVYAIRIVGLDASKNKIELAETPTISGGTWTFRKHFNTGGEMAVSVGVASAGEGSSVAISRASGAFTNSVNTTLAATKSYMDTQLSKAPKPTVWGISGVNAYGVTAAQHKDSYYKSWTFTLFDYMKALPENSTYFPYPQMLCGKPSLWNVGEPHNPGTAQWESLFGYQFLSYIMPNEAWQSFQGLMSLVDASGQLAGESLPTRSAETAWMLYQNTGNLTNLTNVYPNLKRYLLWAEQHPYWNLGGTTANTRDMEFVDSWLFDVEFAIKIANALGNSADVTMWQGKRSPMISNLRNWHFGNPSVINQYYDTVAGPLDIGGDLYRATALAVPNLPADMLASVKEFYMSIHDPSKPLVNFEMQKYPDASLTAYGLLNYGGHVQAKEYIQATLRDMIRSGSFSEVVDRVPSPQGVRPSMFVPITIIEFTWLANGLRIDSGTPTSFTYGSSSFPVPNSPNVIPIIEDFKDISDWTSRFNANMNMVGGTAQVLCECNSGINYGYVGKQVTYNVDENPILSIGIQNVDLASSPQGRWALKVDDGSGDILIQSDSGSTGNFSYNLKAITGWSGSKTFTIKLFVVNRWFLVDYLNAMNYTLDLFDNPASWNASSFNATASTAGSGSNVSVNSTGYGYVSKSFKLNVDQYPYLKLEIIGATGGATWALKVNDGGGDTVLQADTSSTGIFSYNLKNITEWTGSKTFTVRLYVIGNTGASVNANWLNTPVFTDDDFNANTQWNVNSGASIATTGGLGTVTLNTGTSGSVSKYVEYDVNRYNKVIIKVPSLASGATWSLKVNSGGSDITLQASTTSTGEFTFNLQSVTGWTGQKTFRIILGIGGTAGKTVTADYIRMADI